MPKRRSFDESQVLDRAVEVFWRTGFAGTSVDELLEELGLARASLYRTFGSKEQLYQRALARYREKYTAELTQCLQRPEQPVLTSISTLLRQVLTQAADPERPPGCFVVSATTERTPGDLPTTRQVREQYATLEAVLTDALRSAVRAGELPKGTDTVRQSRFLMAMIQGLRVLAPATDPPVLQDVVDATMVALQAPSVD